jgi:hypothetical protein
MEPIPEKHQIGAVLAGLGSFLMFRRALALPPASAHSFDRLICVLLACALAAYAWAVLMAMLARRLEWSPQRCRAAGYPLLILGMLAHSVEPQAKAVLDIGGLVLMAEFAGRLCRRLAFPELGWSGKDPEQPPLSINPRPPS